MVYVNYFVFITNINRCCHVLKSHVSTVTCIGFCNDGNNLISGGRDQIINYWDFMKGQLLKTLPLYEVLLLKYTTPTIMSMYRL